MPEDITVFKSGPEQRINVRKCGSCDGAHQSIEIKDFKKSHAPYTHYYFCPTTSDPVCTTLLCRDGDNSKVHEPNMQIVKHLVEAEAAGEYMVAVYRVDRGVLKLHRTSVEFPTSMFEAAVKLLDQNLTEEAGPPQQVDLVAAKPAGPRINVFEDNGGM